MIKTKSRSCKGVTSKKHPQNMRAGYDYNPALQNLQCLILGHTDLTLNPWAPNLNIASLCDQTKPVGEINQVNKILAVLCAAH